MVYCRHSELASNVVFIEL